MWKIHFCSGLRIAIKSRCPTNLSIFKPSRCLLEVLSNSGATDTKKLAFYFVNLKYEEKQDLENQSRFVRMKMTRVELDLTTSRFVL